MNHPQRTKVHATMFTRSLLAAACLAMSAYGGEAAVAAVTIKVTGPNAVSYWNEVATTTINVAATPGTGSAAEQRPVSSVDQATVQLAVYDALMAIGGAYKPYAITPRADANGASPEAAVSAAAYGVLKGMFPNRSASYQSAFDNYVASIAAGDAKTKGLALGAEVAQRMLALRGDDGRSVVLAAYVPGSAPGQFRGANPINRFQPGMKPLSVTSFAQFRAPAPVALTSDAYTADYDETRTLGGTASSLRTPAQLDIARFHTEPPPAFWPRNLRNFAMTDGTLSDHARVLAMLTTAQADAELTCFESKYFYQAWRPFSAIQLGDTDGNAMTTADPTWTAVLPTPPHPEYPAAHACVTGAVTEVLKAYYRTDQITFNIDSKVTGTSQTFTTTQAMVDNVGVARIYGGMHFRSSLQAGHTLGASVAQWVVTHHFQPR